MYKNRKQTIILLLGIVFGMLLVNTLTSCKKESIKPGNYDLVKPNQQINNVDYIDGGTMPNTNGVKKNELNGTKWVLTYLQIGLSTPPLPIDTLKFVNNNTYVINSGTARTYSLYNNVGTSSKTLILNNHYPFGSGNYAGEIANTFASDGVILNTEFINTNTKTIKIIASFKKI